MADLSSNLKVFLARELQRQFSSLDNSVALFIAGTDNTFTYPNISSSINSISDELKTRRQFQTAKILTDSTVAMMIPRVNWTSGTIYDNYSLSSDNSTKNFYVYTTDGNVYICISNGGGKKSLEEPTRTGTSLIYLSNGYVWKFMYKVPSDLIDFVDSSYIPIKEIPIYLNCLPLRQLSLGERREGVCPLSWLRFSKPNRHIDILGLDRLELLKDRQKSWRK